MLHAAKIGHGPIDVEIAEVDIARVVRRCVQRCAPLTSSNAVDLSVDVPESLPRVSSDAVKLHHVFTNLLVNAIKFTPNGKVVIRARRRDAERLQVEVEDSGIGIAAVALERIWNPFEQADPSVSRRFGGTGLGLSIVRAFVDRLGGEISVESTLGKGTTFTVALPIAQGGRANA